MNIIEACRLLYSFCGFAQQKRRFDSEIYLNGCLEVMDGALDNPNQKYQNYKPSLADILDDRWLYYNDKFECLTCETCYKLLNDMEGLAPVCECATGVKIGDTVKVTVKDIAIEIPEAGSSRYSGTIKYYDGKEDKPTYEYPSIDMSHHDNDSCICPACSVRKQMKLGEHHGDEMSDVGTIFKTPPEQNGLIAGKGISLNGYEVKWPQYPGMIEVNYCSGYKTIIHYSTIRLWILGDDRYYVCKTSEAHTEADKNVVSEQEYNRILNLFKASGLEVSE